jgi:hypothetical protein
MEQAFRPKAVICQINGKGFIIECITAGWCWRNEDGDCQEDFGIAPFGTATEAQQSAMSHVSQKRREALNVLCLRQNELWKSQPRCNLAASPERSVSISNVKRFGLPPCVRLTA